VTIKRFVYKDQWRVKMSDFITFLMSWLAFDFCYKGFANAICVRVV
jgi:hypothetical protein